MKHLFLAVPAYCGSTVLHNYLAKCSAVAPLTTHSNRYGLVEGSHVYPYAYHKNDSINVLSETLDILNYTDPIKNNYSELAKVWGYNWDGCEKENTVIRLQKTPSDIWRVQVFQNYFNNLYWIVSVKNPYAYAGALLKRYIETITNQDLINAIAEHVANCLNIQNENKTFLGDKAYVMTFEDFVANESAHIAGLKAWMPELSDLTFTGFCKYKGTVVQGLINNNEQHLDFLKTIPDAMDKFTTLFKPHEAVINSWGYELI